MMYHINIKINIEINSIPWIVEDSHVKYHQHIVVCYTSHQTISPSTSNESNENPIF